MSDSGVMIRLDRAEPVYHPGETLACTLEVSTEVGRDVDALEVSVLWSTEGKGDEDVGVHFFERLSAQAEGSFAPGRPRPFSTRLPRSPLSYDGVIVKVCWCVRVRVFEAGGRMRLAETPFRLGEVARAQEVLA